jgi:hypothetical protein
VKAKPAHEPGRFISRDISRGEAVATDLDILITRRHDRRVLEEGERPPEEAWAESERRQEARRHEENRAAWCCEYHQEQAERHRSVERHQDRYYHEPQLRGG